MPDFLFMIVRMDDHGQNFLVRDDLTEQESVVLMASLDHHRQSYTILEYTPDMKPAMMFKHGVIIENETGESLH